MARASSCSVNGQSGQCDGSGRCSIGVDYNSKPAVLALPTDIPEVTAIGAGTVAERTSFLFGIGGSSSNPVQTPQNLNGAPVQIVVDSNRQSALRGRVLGQDGLPLPQVTVTVKGRPQYGQTQTRADGYFDLAVEGGGGLTVEFKRDGYFPAQRLISVDWNQYGNLEDIVMVAPDSTVPVSTINLACNTSGGNNCPAIGLPVHAAPKVTSDAQPARGAIVIFPHNVKVTEAPDNQSVMQPTTVNVSTTEYTKDISVEGTSLNGANPISNGRLAMPGNLPPASCVYLRGRLVR